MNLTDLSEVEEKDLSKQLEDVEQAASRLASSGRVHDAKIIEGLVERVRGWKAVGWASKPFDTTATTPVAPKKRRGRPPKNKAVTADGAGEGMLAG